MKVPAGARTYALAISLFYSVATICLVSISNVRGVPGIPLWFVIMWILISIALSAYLIWVLWPRPRADWEELIERLRPILDERIKEGVRGTEQKSTKEGGEIKKGESRGTPTVILLLLIVAITVALGRNKK